jgi:hypothetical protein
MKDRARLDRSVPDLEQIFVRTALAGVEGHRQSAGLKQIARYIRMQGARENSTTTQVTVVRAPYSVRAEQAVWLVAGVVDALLIIRFLFELLGASNQASFVRFIYDLTQTFVSPFHGIFNTAASGHNVFEPESLVALLSTR